MRTLKQIRREEKFQSQLREQSFLHSQGQIDPELARRLTKPKQAEAMYQVFVDVLGEDGSRPCSPRFAGAAGQESCAQIMQVINAQISIGKLKGWGNARIESIVHLMTN